MPRKTKAALAVGRCPDCQRELEVIDTWERACPTPGCGYTFNYYHWPWITAELPSDEYRPLVACWLLEQLAARPGVTQAEVARAIGVSQQRISEWLRGRKRPRERNCIRLAQFFGADPTTVMALAGHQVNVPLVAAEATASTFGPPSLPTGGASPASAQGPRSIREEAAQWLARLPVAIPIYERNLGQEPPGPPADYAYWDPAKAAGRHIWGIRVLEHPLEPEIRVGDTLFIDVDRPPVHGDLVASLRGRPGVPPALPATARRDSLSG